KYPIEKALVATREPISVNVNEIKEVKLIPGPLDGYGGARGIPLVAPRIADLLQTKPSASCRIDYECGLADCFWVSYDKSFPAEELRRLCETEGSDKKIVKSLKARDIFSLSFPFD
ncbi:MAG: hypothetical protein P8182_17190, partial [Deltaproteobacteria bacterium]